MKKFIVLEGCDGVGKSSCAIELAKKINGFYYKTPPELFTKNFITENIKENYELRFYYYLVGILYSVSEIKKILLNQHVVCDRYIYSTIAYHKALGVNIPDNLEKSVMIPDYCFCLYMNEDSFKKRMEEREIASVFDRDFKFQKKVFLEFKKFNLDFFETSDLDVKQSVKQLIKKIRF